MKRFFLALQFLTILPVKTGIEAPSEELGRSMGYFPAVGAVVGLVLVICDFFFLLVLPGDVTACLLLVILAIVSGALHLDGFADTVDGIAGGATPEERLKIMRDGNVGPAGVISVVLLLLLKYLAIRNLSEGIRWMGVFFFPVIGRWSMVAMAYWSGYARSEGIGKAFAGAERGAFLKATAFTALVSIFFFGPFGILAIGLTGLVAYIFAAFFRNKVGGVTGDIFGFQNEFTEVFFLMLVLALNPPVMI